MKTGRVDLQKATPPEIQGHPSVLGGPRRGPAPVQPPGRGLAHALCAPTLRKVGVVERLLDGQLSNFEKALAVMGPAAGKLGDRGRAVSVQAVLLGAGTHCRGPRLYEQGLAPPVTRLYGWR